MKIRSLFLSLAVVCASGAGLVSSAQAGTNLFGSGVKLDDSFCRQNPARQTVVYVDDTDVVKGQVDWAQTLLLKLQQTLMPGERTTVVQLSPQHGLSKEIWTGCWPNFSNEEKKKIAGQTHFFSANPLSSLQEQQGFFKRDLGQAITKIFMSSQKLPADVAIDPRNPPSKSIVRALASDAGRFTNVNGTIRAIVYSDMVEHSDIGDVFLEQKASTGDLSQKLGVNLHRSVFYFFGVAGTIKDDGKSVDNIRRFWQNAMEQLGANIAGIGADLSIVNAVPVIGKTFDVSLTHQGRNLNGRLFLMVDQDGQLVDSWIGITLIRSAVISGNLHCLDNWTQCSLDGSLNAPLVNYDKPERLVLRQSGSPSLFANGSVMQGKVGVPDTNVDDAISVTLLNQN